MSDYISRESALNCFHDWVDKHGDVHTADEMVEYQRIEALPSAQRWIPCAERLPEEGQMVIVTIRGHDVIRCEADETLEEAIDRVMQMLRVSVGFLYDDGWFGVDGYAMMVQPVAWMPLPEPWKGEK